MTPHRMTPLPMIDPEPSAPQHPAAPPPSTPQRSADHAHLSAPPAAPRRGWSRRGWLQHNAAFALGSAILPAVTGHRTAGVAPGALGWHRRASTSAAAQATRAARVAAHAQLADPTVLEALAQRAVEAAHAAGATYADARVTRTIRHAYAFLTRTGPGGPDALDEDFEMLGLGVRALVNGYWGFGASALWTPEEAVRLAQDAVAQAKINARGTPRTVELDEVPVVTGRWATPVEIDPFSVSIEEKSDAIAYWMACAQEVEAWGGRGNLQVIPNASGLQFARQEQALATSAGTLVSQTRYETSGNITVGKVGDQNEVGIQGIAPAGKGWELFLEADIPSQLQQLPAQIDAIRAMRGKPASVGRYTLVCDGRTMAHIVEQTFGIATQLDRALGYEANAGGTSYLDDPLGMLGSLQVAAPQVTITANRSAPAQLATVKWDVEGVAPEETTLVKNGVLVDYQTTREQAAWLAPYYQKAGKPVRSHGHAAAEDALSITLQHMPNLALEPGPAAVGVMDLVSNVKDGLFVHNPFFDNVWVRTDPQARNGYFAGRMQQITNGRLGPVVGGGAVLFNTQDLWKKVVALGGPATASVYSFSGFNNFYRDIRARYERQGGCKGQPAQLTSHSVRAVAATIIDQPLIILSRKA